MLEWSLSLFWNNDPNPGRKPLIFLHFLLLFLLVFLLRFFFFVSSHLFLVLSSSSML